MFSCEAAAAAALAALSPAEPVSPAYGSYPMAFCQMLCVLSEDDVCMRLPAGIFTLPAVAGMVT